MKKIAKLVKCDFYGTGIAAIMLMILFGICSPSCAAVDKKAVVLTDAKQTSCLIVVPPESQISKHAAVRLQSFIEKACGKAPKVQEKTALGGESDGQVVIAIGNADSFAGLEKFGLAADLAKLNHDGYMLRTAYANGRTYILTLGRSEKAAVNAVWQLIREANIENGAISVPQLAVAQSPWIKTREVTLYSPWIRDDLKSTPFPTRLAEKYILRNWDEDRLRNYVDLMDSFGYNSIETNDVWVGLANMMKGNSRQQW